MTIIRTDFSRRQWRIFFGCFTAYFFAYTTRLNLPAALDSLMTEMSLTGAQGGLLQTVFALVYACGQFVNGAIVDRVSARRHILLGLSLSGLFNLLFGLTTHYWMLVLLWALNGAAQSMLWTPIVKLMAVWFKGRRRSRGSFGMTLSLIAGHFCAWLMSGYLASLLNWRWSFTIPAILAMLAAGASRFILLDEPEPSEELGEEETAAQPSFSGRRMPVGTVLIATGLVQILICCVGNGFVRDGIITWAPVMIARFGGTAVSDPTHISLVIPLLNLIGVLFARKAYAALHDSARRCVGFLMLLSAVFAFLLIPVFHGSVPAFALLLGLCCSAAYGINPMLTTFIPMEYERAGRVGLVAGMTDSSIYLGSSLAGVITGAIRDAAGWRPVFIIWGLAAAASCAAALVSARHRKAGRPLKYV